MTAPGVLIAFCVVGGVISGLALILLASAASARPLASTLDEPGSHDLEAQGEN